MRHRQGCEMSRSDFQECSGALSPKARYRAYRQSQLFPSHLPSAYGIPPHHISPSGHSAHLFIIHYIAPEGAAVAYRLFLITAPIYRDFTVIRSGCRIIKAFSGSSRSFRSETTGPRLQVHRQCLSPAYAASSFVCLPTKSSVLPPEAGKEAVV